MKELFTEIEIAASAEAVWSVLVDLDAFPAWNPFIPRAGGTVKEGERLRVHIAPPGGKAMDFSPTVVRVTKHREFRWLGRLGIPGLFDGEHIFEIEPKGDGNVRFVQRETFKGLLVPLLWRSISGPTKQGFEDMNEALKQRAESRGRGASGSW